MEFCLGYYTCILQLQNMCQGRLSLVNVILIVLARYVKNYTDNKYPKLSLLCHRTQRDLVKMQLCVLLLTAAANNSVADLYSSPATVLLQNCYRRKNCTQSSSSVILIWNSYDFFSLICCGTKMRATRPHQAGSAAAHTKLDSLLLHRY
jgi:hypothetical protein